jgi:glyoxylase-like metal-dependent hydrolase (beta-lactamase superfamily II)
VLHRLTERAWWVQAFNYGTVFYVSERGVLVFDTPEGVCDNVTQAVSSVTDKPIIAAVYRHYHADHIGDIDKYVEAARRQKIDFQIYASTKARQSMDLARGLHAPVADRRDRHRAYREHGPARRGRAAAASRDGVRRLDRDRHGGYRGAGHAAVS